MSLGPPRKLGHTLEAGVCTKNSDSDVVVMQSTEESMRHDAVSLDRARERRIFVQQPVRSHFIVNIWHKISALGVNASRRDANARESRAG